MQTDLRHSLLEQRPVSFAKPLYLPGSSNMEVLQPYHNSRTFTEAVALSLFDWTISKYKAKVPQSEVSLRTMPKGWGDNAISKMPNTQA